MIGRIRTEQRCPRCKGTFAETPDGLMCVKCLTQPTRYLIDVYWKGKRPRIFKDSSGQVLDSFERADRLLNHIRWEIDNHKFRPEKYVRTKYEPYMMEVFALDWLAEQELRQRSNEISYSSYQKFKGIVERYIVPYFGRDDMRTIGTKGIKNFNLHLAGLKVRGKTLMSPKYREDIMGILRQMYNDSLKSEEISRAQVPVFPTIEVPDPGFEVLQENEQDEILEKIPDFDRPIFGFILQYATRPSEARAIKRDAVIGDFDKIVIRRTFTRNNRLKDNPKEGKWRSISLVEETKEMLRSLPLSMTGFLFVNKWDRPYSQSYLNDVWNESCDKAGFRRIRLYHASRHSLGTKLADEGYSEDMIATVLGHSNTKTTKRYVRYASDPLKKFFERRNKKGTVSRLSVTKK